MWEILKQLASAVAYCHYGVLDAASGETPSGHWVGVVHRDIKPANLFLSVKHPGAIPRVMLGEFGRAMRLDEGRSGGRPFLKVDPFWRPPEAPSFGIASDVWSMGTVAQVTCLLGPSIDGVRAFCGVRDSYSDFLNDTIHAAIRTSPHDRPPSLVFAQMLPR